MADKGEQLSGLTEAEQEYLFQYIEQLQVENKQLRERLEKSKQFIVVIAPGEEMLAEARQRITELRQRLDRHRRKPTKAERLPYIERCLKDGWTWEQVYKHLLADYPHWLEVKSTSRNISPANLKKQYQAWQRKQRKS